MPWYPSMLSYADRIRLEAAERLPRCDSCGMRTFHLPTCPNSRLTPEQRDAAVARREMIDAAIRRVCTICHLEILPGEDRAFGPPARHLDCAVELEAQLDEDHAELP